MGAQAASASSSRPEALIGGAPDSISFEAGNGDHPGFAATASLHHTLQDLECVKAINVVAAKTDCDRFLELDAVLMLQPWGPPSNDNT